MGSFPTRFRNPMTTAPHLKSNVHQSSPNQDWCMEGCLPGHDSITHLSLRSLEVKVGRDPLGDICLASPNVSKCHARFVISGDQIQLEDLGSTNGTFVNGQRILTLSSIKEGDLVQFADVELRLVRTLAPTVDCTAVETRPEHRWALSSMHKVLSGNSMNTYFQPIVDAGDDYRSIGYEALVRATVDGLESPIVLFDQASRLGVEKRLSELCRKKALEAIDGANVSGTLFLNTHPNESLKSELLASIRALREKSPNRKIVVEIHEKAATNLAELSEFSAALHDLDILLAFDDFGAGESRLVELCKVSPDILKFDRSLIVSLAEDEKHYRLVANLHESARELGISTLAEGVETAEQIAACDEIGFDLYQGYAFGKPLPISNYA